MKKIKKQIPLKTTEVAIFDGPIPRLSTVNVIEFTDGEILDIVSFPDTEEGNKNAEIKFHDLIRENNADELEEDIEAAIEDGYYEKGTHKLNLTHSS